jgi:DNA-binding response OmpR family regulator
MFDFAGRLRLQSRTNHTSETMPEVSIKLLLVTPDDDLYLSVHKAAKRCGWRIERVRSVEESLHLLDTFRPLLVIYDWTPEEDDWRLAIDRLSAEPDHPCILLASRVIDEYLWAELVTHGGFDVISRSADTDQLIRSVRFAHRSTDITRGGRSLPR